MSGTPDKHQSLVSYTPSSGGNPAILLRRYEAGGVLRPQLTPIDGVEPRRGLYRRGVLPVLREWEELPALGKIDGSGAEVSAMTSRRSREDVWTSVLTSRDVFVFMFCFNGYNDIVGVKGF